MPCQGLGHALAHVADRQGVEEAVEARLAGLPNRLVELPRRFFGKPLELFEFVGLEPIQVGQRRDHFALDQLLRRLFAQMLDVEGFARAVVLDAPLELGTAGEPAGAQDVRPLAHHRGAAGGTFVGHAELARRLVGTLDALDHLGDNVAGALDAHLVPLAQVLLLHLAFVVQGGAADGHAADVDRVEQRHRRKDAAGADLDDDLLERCDLPLRLELPGDGPARRAMAGTQLAAQRQVVELDDDAVDFVGQFVALLTDLLAEIGDFVETRGPAVVRVGLQVPLLEGLQFVPVAVELFPLYLEDFIEEDVKGPAGDDLRFEPPQGSGTGIARVGEGVLAVLDPLPVQFLERLLRQEDFAAHGEEIGRVLAAQT